MTEGHLDYRPERVPPRRSWPARALAYPLTLHQAAWIMAGMYPESFPAWFWVRLYYDGVENVVPMHMLG